MEIQKIDPVFKSFSNTIDQAVGSEEVSKIFLTKYKALFNSVPTSDTDLEGLHDVMHDNVDVDNRVNFDSIQRCIKKLKPHKDDGNYRFKSDHVINGLNKLFIMLSIMFNTMLTHVFNPEDLLLSTIISIPKYNRGSMNSSDNYRGISLSNSICKLYDYVIIDLNMDCLKTDDMQFGFK